MQDVKLIERSILFGNPERASVQVSPDGERIAYLAPNDDNVLNVFVASWDDPTNATQVTDDKVRGIRMYAWASTGNHIVYMQDEGGDEDWHLYSTDLETKKTIDLTPLEGISAQIVQGNYLRPETIVVGINDRNPQLHDLYEIDVTTGERSLLVQNDRYIQYVVDEQYRPRLATVMTPDGEIIYFDVTGEEPTPFLTVPHDDTMNTAVLGTDLAGEVFYLMDSREYDTAALVKMTADGASEMLFEPAKADLSGMMSHPKTMEIEAVAWTYDRKEWHFFDDRVKSLIETLQKVTDGDVEITSRSLDDRRWVAAFLKDDGPVEYYKFDTETREAEFMFTNRPTLEGLPLVNMEPIVIEARDGLDLVSYLSLPPGVEGRPDVPLPMVLDVHGGPWARDSWGYNPEHQWFANRGYAVLSVNFRGSTGFGKSFINASSKQWGRAMHDDLLDAVAWAVDEGIADPDKVAIYGGSYGGYATLWGMTNTPETFAAGISIVGPSSLETLLDSIPEYWKPMLEMFAHRVGDPRTEEGRALLRERSPLSYVDHISKPLLIGQGANDPRVKQAESDQIVDSMQSRDLPVTYVLFPDEGHGFARPENRLAFYGVAEAFLAEHLGGRYEPLVDFAKSSIHVPEGAEQVPGLKSSLCEKDPSRCAMPAQG